jgi:hypothetical protein
MDFRVLLDEAARQTRVHFAALFPAAAVPLTLAYLALALGTIYWTRALTGGDDPGDFLAIAGGCGTMALALLVLGLAQSLTSGAVGAAAVDAVAGRPLRAAAGWRFALRPSVLLTLIGLGLLVGLGLMCCLVPGLLAVAYYGFAVPVMAEESVTLGGALRRSSQLASYNPQRRLFTSPKVKLLVLLFVGYVLSQAVSMLVQMPFVAAQQALLLRDLAAGGDHQDLALHSRWQWLQVPGTVLGGLAQAAVVVYLSLGTALLYFDVRGRRDGADLEAELDALLTGPAGPPAEEA